MSQTNNMMNTTQRVGSFPILGGAMEATFHTRMKLIES